MDDRCDGIVESDCIMEESSSREDKVIVERDDIIEEDENGY